MLINLLNLLDNGTLRIVRRTSKMLFEGPSSFRKIKKKETEIRLFYSIYEEIQKYKFNFLGEEKLLISD